MRTICSVCSVSKPAAWQNRVRGWKRIALFALFFNPGGITVKSTADSFRDAQRTVRARARALASARL
jgi:hypothetical protein